MLNIYIDSTIRAPRRGDGKGMYLVEYVSDKDPEKIETRQGLLYLPDTTEDEIMLTTLIEGVNILNRPCKIRIFTNAKHIFSTLESHKNADLRSRKWLSASEKSIKNAPLWEIITQQLEKHDWTITSEEHSFREYMKSELKKWQ